MKYELPHINLHLSTESFYCPVTGQQLLYPEYFDPSPALIFNYFDDYNSFNEATPEIEALYKECLEELGVEGEPKDIKPFQKLVNEKLEKYLDQYLLLEMGDAHQNLFYCFDLAYNPNNKVLEKNSGIVPTSQGMDEAVLNMVLGNLFCPATGMLLVDEGRFNPSPALEFIYSHATKTFEIINDDLREEFNKYFSGNENYTKKKLYEELTSQNFASSHRHILLTFGSKKNMTSVCVDMTDPEYSKERTFHKQEH